MTAWMPASSKPARRFPGPRRPDGGGRNPGYRRSHRGRWGEPRPKSRPAGEQRTQEPRPSGPPYEPSSKALMPQRTKQEQAEVYHEALTGSHLRRRGCTAGPEPFSTLFGASATNNARAADGCGFLRRVASPPAGDDGEVGNPLGTAACLAKALDMGDRKLDRAGEQRLVRHRPALRTDHADRAERAAPADHLALVAAGVTLVLWASAFVAIRSAGSEFSPGGPGPGQVGVRVGGAGPGDVGPAGGMAAACRLAGHRDFGLALVRRLHGRPQLGRAESRRRHGGHGRQPGPGDNRASWAPGCSERASRAA